MRIPALTTSFALALAVAACGGNTANDATNDMSTDVNLTDDAMANDMLGANDTMAMNGSAAATPTDAAGFANAVAATDMFEIESAKLAADKAQSADLKSFAAMLRRDHEKSTADLKAAAGSMTVTPALDAEKQGMLDTLKATSGAAFDRTYVEQLKAGHQKALAVVKTYAGSGDNASLKTFASAATTVIQGHLDKLNAMKM